MKDKSRFAMLVPYLTAIIMIVVVSLHFVHSNKQRVQINNKLKSLSSEVEAFHNVSNEILLYRKIEDRWFEEGSEYMPHKTLRELAFITYKYHQKYGSDGQVPIGLDYWRIFAWLNLESNFDPGAESYAGAIGLTQHMFITGIDGLDRYFDLSGLGKEEVLIYLYDPVWSLRLGLERLVDYQTDFISTGVASASDWKLTFSLYNWSTMAVSNLMTAIEGGTPKASLKYALAIERTMKGFL